MIWVVSGRGYASHAGAARLALSGHSSVFFLSNIIYTASRCEP